MEKEILNIAISGEEKNKNEIIYNNIVEAMETLKMSKDDQIEYLKTKLNYTDKDIEFFSRVYLNKKYRNHREMYSLLRDVYNKS